MEEDCLNVLHSDLSVQERALIGLSVLGGSKLAAAKMSLGHFQVTWKRGRSLHSYATYLSTISQTRVFILSSSIAKAIFCLTICMIDGKKQVKGLGTNKGALNIWAKWSSVTQWLDFPNMRWSPDAYQTCKLSGLNRGTTVELENLFFLWARTSGLNPRITSQLVGELLP